MSKTLYPTTANEALQWLKDGNNRFIENLKTPHNNTVSTNVLPTEHNPSAIILGCSDARVPAELVFDQGLGDLFVIRVAGNIVAPSQIGSVEFATEKFGTKLVVVLGHSHCGAVTACVDTFINPDQYFSPNLRSIVDRIRPSVYNLHEIYTSGGQDMDAEELIHRSIKANVRMSVSQLKHASRSLEDLVDSGQLLIVGAHYDLETGVVRFFE